MIFRTGSRTYPSKSTIIICLCLRIFLIVLEASMPSSIFAKIICLLTKEGKSCENWKHIKMRLLDSSKSNWEHVGRMSTNLELFFILSTRRRQASAQDNCIDYFDCFGVRMSLWKNYLILFNSRKKKTKKSDLTRASWSAHFVKAPTRIARLTLFSISAKLNLFRLRCAT